MKTTKILVIIIIATSITFAPTQRANAVIPIAAIIKAIIQKVVRALDLAVQRAQQKTLVLQNAQKVLENALSKLKLQQIADWTEKHRKLYQEYYDELWKIRNTIANYQRIQQILQRQVQLVKEYKHVWNAIEQDGHFTKNELDYMFRVYTGILNESIRNLEQLNLIINAMRTQVSDAMRLKIINACGDRIEKNYSDLKQFNNQNIQLSINRAKDQSEVETVQKLYGLNP